MGFLKSSNFIGLTLEKKEKIRNEKKVGLTKYDSCPKILKIQKSTQMISL